eukprot:TRINITY_DN9277_c0_g1_i2.p1 TRINITY_DN9277_c0_g1~~TRINITY_DN9277_c0_g1_i2.p1  ORF type:complete len:386 (+),score=95.00 TRINITY_DN9277_c0_g1_i2:60-1217(+)
MFVAALFFLHGLRASAERYAAFATAEASSVYSPAAFGASMATSASSGYWCSAGGHSAGQVVSWTGALASRRALRGINIHWSYAPAEVKVLVSADGGNFEEAAGWRTNVRTEPSFEQAVMFAEVVSAKAVTILMRGPKAWGFFGIASATAISGPYPFMLVSGQAAVQEQCVVAKSHGVALQPCLDAIVAGDGSEVLTFSEGGQLQLVSGQCLAVVGGLLSVEDCQGQSVWSLTADGQVKHGNTCLSAASNTELAAVDCALAVAEGADKFFEVAVASHDSTATLAVRSVGALMQAAVKRQRQLLDAIHTSLPKLDKCSLGGLGVVRNITLPSSFLLSQHHLSLAGGEDEVMQAVRKISGHFGIGHGELAKLLLASSEALAAVSAKLS